MKSSKLLTLLLSSTLPIPLLYMVGLGYYEGMLHGLKLSSTIYPLSMENALIYGYFFLYANWQFLFVIPVALIILGLILLLINSRKLEFHQNPNSFLKSIWAIEEWFRKYLGKDERLVFSAAKVISLVVYLGLVLFVIVALAFGEGKEISFKKLSQSKCQLTDDKGRVSLDKGATIELKHSKQPSNVYILMLSDKFLSYYVESSNGKKSMHTVPMSQVKYISAAADIFSDSWSEVSEKACE